MKMMKTLLATVVALSITGCASTSNSNSTPKYPVLKVLSDKPYDWDNNASEALNVAKMAQPAGVGVGMMDYPDGTKATTGRVSSGMQLFDAALGLRASGLFGVFQMGALNEGVNSALDWKPSVIQLVNVEEVQVDGKLSFLKIRDKVASGIKTAVEKEFGDVYWGDVLTLKRNEIANVTIVVRNSDMCHKSMNFISQKGSHKGYVDFNYSDHYIDGKNASENHCVIALNTKVAGYLEGNDKVILSSEIISGHYFNDAIAKNHVDYVIVPDYYKIRASDSPVDLSIVTDHAFVMKNGKKMLFEKKGG